MASQQNIEGQGEPDMLVARLRGRAQFLRDHGEIKTPSLLEQAANALSTQPERSE